MSFDSSSWQNKQESAVANYRRNHEFARDVKGVSADITGRTIWMLSCGDVFWPNGHQLKGVITRKQVHCTQCQLRNDLVEFTTSSQ